MEANLSTKRLSDYASWGGRHSVGAFYMVADRMCLQTMWQEGAAMNVKPRLIFDAGQWHATHTTRIGTAWYRWHMGMGRTPAEAYAQFAVREISRLQGYVSQWIAK